MHDRKDFPFLVAGGSILAFLSGYLNAGALTVYSWPVGHATGIASKAGISIGMHAFTDFAFCVGITLAFIAGACCSAIVVGNTKFALGRRYGVALLIESAVIFLAFILEEFVEKTVAFGSLLLLGFASGFQNAMTTTFSGAVIRTTHITGTVTDIGTTIGIWLRYRKSKPNRPELWKLKILVPLMVSYFAGAMVGGTVARALYHWFALLPSIAFAVVGIIYIILQWRGFGQVAPQSAEASAAGGERIVGKVAPGEVESSHLIDVGPRDTSSTHRSTVNDSNRSQTEQMAQEKLLNAKLV